jgi:uncharacterized cupin superfamily protein
VSAATGPEAPLRETEHGLAASGDGWFVLNAHDARWRHRKGIASLVFDGETHFEQIGIAVVVLWPGTAMTMYHREDDQEDFLVLSGEPLLIVEGQERPLRQWDFVHCPPQTQHAFVGAGDGPSVVLATGAREHEVTTFTVDEAASRHGASVEKETTDWEEAYAGVTERSQPTRYQDDWLPI